MKRPTLVRPALVVSLAMLGPLWAVPAASAAPPLPPKVAAVMEAGDYRSRVDEAASLAGAAARIAGVGTAPGRVDAMLAKIDRLLPARETIVFEGRAVRVDNSSLAGLLRQARGTKPGRPRRRLLVLLAERLRAMRLQMSVPAPAAGNRRVLRRIVARSNLGRADPLGGAVAKVVAWLRNLINRRLNAATGGRGVEVPAPPNWSLVTAAVLVITVALLLMTRLLVRRRRAVAIQTPQTRLDVEEVSSEDDLYAKACERASAGDNREAVRLLFRSLQVQLDRKRVARFRRTQTNSEYLQAVASSAPRLADLVRRMVSVFERKWYGLQECTPDEYAGYEAAYHDVVREADRPGGETP